MKLLDLTRVAFLVVCCSTIALDSAFAKDPPRRSGEKVKSPSEQKSPGEQTEANQNGLVLEMRKNFRAYEKSAFSFRYQTQDLNVHRNNVDLNYHNCGLLHVNMHGGSQNTIVDLGVKDLDAVNEMPKAGWRFLAIQPVTGHTYIQKVQYLRKSFFVKFKITEMKDRKIKIQWAPLDPQAKPVLFATPSGYAGVSGLCGGPHPER